MDKEFAEEFGLKLSEGKETESSVKKLADRLREMSNKIKEASKLPPHLAKFFDKKGNLKPEVAARIAKGREKLNIKDVTLQKWLSEKSVQKN